MRGLRSGRDKSAYYRMQHLHQRAGTRAADLRSPGQQVPFETALLALGEESGKMEDVLRLLADYFQAEDRMVQKAVRWSAYPMMTAFAATFIAPLPLLFTKFAGAYAWAVASGLALWLLAAGALLTGVTGWYLNQPRFVLARLLRGLTVAIEAGLGLDRAALLAAEASGNAAVLAHVRRQSARARTSQPLSATFRGCPHVPFTAIAAMEVADRSGDYGGTLVKLAQLHDG